MTSARITKLLLLFAFTTAPWCVAQQARNQPLQLTIRQTSQKLFFQFDLHNTGEHALTLWLGWTGSLSQQKPSAVALSLTDAKGTTFPIILQGSPTEIISPMNPSIVTLTPGAIWSFQVNLKDYALDGESEDSHYPPIVPGQYTLQAVYIGKDSSAFVDGRDHRTKPTTPYWKGTVTSNKLPFTIPAQ